MVREDEWEDLRLVKSLSRAFRVYLHHWTVKLLIANFALLSSLRAARGSWSLSDLIVVVAIAIYWPFQEWFLHQEALHFRPRKIFGVFVDPFTAKIHRKHHAHPWRGESTFLPLRVVVLLVPINSAVWWLVMPTPELALTGASAFNFAALIYEWIHYLTHTGHKPRSKHYRRVWRNHRLHHFKSELYWHAFTMPVSYLILSHCR